MFDHKNWKRIATITNKSRVENGEQKGTSIMRPKYSFISELTGKYIYFRGLHNNTVPLVHRDTELPNGCGSCCVYTTQLRARRIVSAEQYRAPRGNNDLPSDHTAAIVYWFTATCDLWTFTNNFISNVMQKVELLILSRPVILWKSVSLLLLSKVHFGKYYSQFSVYVIYIKIRINYVCYAYKCTYCISMCNIYKVGYLNINTLSTYPVIALGPCTLMLWHL